MDEEELMRRAQELSLQDPSQAQGGDKGISNDTYKRD